MWEVIKSAGKQLLQAGAAHLQHRLFINSLFSMTEQQAYQALRQRVFEMDDEQTQSFVAAFQSMLGEAQAAAQNSASWGGSVEDQIAQRMAELQTGQQSQPDQQTQMYLQGLVAIGQYAEQFYQEKLQHQASAGSEPESFGFQDVEEEPPAQSTDAGSSPDAEDLLARLQEGISRGELDPELLSEFAALGLGDSDTIEQLLSGLQEMGADAGSPTLSAADHYRPGPGRYSLLWELDSSLELPEPFADLDREMQFHVLFSEFMRREMIGMTALTAGNTDEARTIFEECLERARQLDVAELRARTFEDLMRVAQREGDREAEREWLDAAIEARS